MLQILFVRGLFSNSIVHFESFLTLEEAFSKAPCTIHCDKDIFTLDVETFADVDCESERLASLLDTLKSRLAAPNNTSTFYWKSITESNVH